MGALNEKTLAQWEHFAAGCKPGSKVGLLLGGYANLCQNRIDLPNDFKDRPNDSKAVQS